jgi:hypothetical protein
VQQNEPVQEYVYRPTFSRILAVITSVICLVGLIIVLIQDGIGEALQVVPWLLLAAGAAWMVFWYPAVHVDDGGVRLINVTRTIDLPWPSISRIDTKWALALVTSYGTYTAWVAPAPSRMSARKLSRQESGALPESTYVAKDTIRPGDAPGSPSGDVALVIRRRWDALRDAGHLDNPRLEADRPRVHWHVLQIVAAVLLLGLGILSAGL